MKYRAFDKQTNHMYYSPNEHIYLNIDGTCVNFQNGEILETMLFTGYSDGSENRTQIYCNDICKGNGGASDFYFEVVFEDGCFVCNMPWGVQAELKHYIDISFGTIVIVGNTKQHKIEDFQ